MNDLNTHLNESVKIPNEIYEVMAVCSYSKLYNTTDMKNLSIKIREYEDISHVGDNEYDILLTYKTDDILNNVFKLYVLHKDQPIECFRLRFDVVQQLEAI
jgi:hypothetical protein